MDTQLFNLINKEKELEEAGRILAKGGLVAFPTETVYGLGGDALNASSSKKIYEAKKRPSDNPLIVHIDCIERLDKIVKDISPLGKKLANQYWPGPMTLIFWKKEIVPYETTGGLETVAVRLPSHPIAREFIRRAGGYVAAPSANVSGRPSPTKAIHVVEDMWGRIDGIIDGGACEIGLESTIIDCSGNSPILLRPGYITKEDFADLMGDFTRQYEAKERPKAPGMKYKHYAPAGELFIIRGKKRQVQEYIKAKSKEYQSQGISVGILTTKDDVSWYKSDLTISLGSLDNEKEIASRLFDSLRQMDGHQIQIILSEVFDTPRLGEAIMNRLEKAAGFKIIDLKEGDTIV